MPIKQVEEGFTPFKFVTQTMDVDSGVTPSVNHSTSVTTAFSRPKFSMKRVWARTDNYLSKKASGTLPENHFYYEEIRCGDASVKCSRVDNLTPTYRSHRTRFSNTIGYHNFRFADRVLTDFDVKSKAISALKVNQANVPVFLAEVHKTRAMVAEAATHLARAVWELKRGNISAFLMAFQATRQMRDSRRRKIISRFNRDFGRDASQATANVLLETRYGWTPVISDVRSTVLALMDTLERPDITVRTTRVTSRKRTELQDSTSDVESTPHLAAHKRITLDESYRIVLRSRIKPEDVLGRFGLTNPAENAYELLPFSFVADWFLPIGAYLAALDAHVRFEFVSGSISYKQVITESLSDYSSHEWQSVEGGRSVLTGTMVQRIPLTDLPVPDFTSMRPSFDLSLTQLENGLALLVQAGRGSTRPYRWR